ncbi:MAG: hypothetical protein ACXAEN_12400 [Candidatus Thorarchaeota archaeon]
MMLFERLLRKLIPTIDEASTIDTEWPIICAYIRPHNIPKHVEFHQYDRYILTVRRFDTSYPVIDCITRRLYKELPMTYTTILAWMPRLKDKDGKAYFRFLESY